MCDQGKNVGHVETLNVGMVATPIGPSLQPCLPAGLSLSHLNQTEQEQTAADYKSLQKISRAKGRKHFLSH